MQTTVTNTENTCINSSTTLYSPSSEPTRRYTSVPLCVGHASVVLRLFIPCCVNMRVRHPSPIATCALGCLGAICRRSESHVWRLQTCCQSQLSHVPQGMYVCMYVLNVMYLPGGVKDRGFGLLRSVVDTLPALLDHMRTCCQHL